MFTVALEGPDFCGKSTIATALLMHLRETGASVERSELPSRLVTGLFTDLLRNSRDRVAPEVFALVYAADHLHHHNRIMKGNPADVLILERSALSFFVYEGLVMGVDMDWLRELNRYNGTRPDLTVVLKVPVEELVRRAGFRRGSEDAFEKEEFLRKVARAFYSLPDWLVEEFNVVYVEPGEIGETAERIAALIRS